MNNFVIKADRKKNEFIISVVINNNYDKISDYSSLSNTEKYNLAEKNNYIVRTIKKNGSFNLTVKTRSLFLIDSEMYEEEFKDLNYKQLDTKMSYINIVQFFNFNNLENTESFKNNQNYISNITFKEEISSFLYDYYKSLNYCFIDVYLD